MQKRLSERAQAPRPLAALLGDPSMLALLLALLGIGLILGAFGFEYLGRIKPCHLCLGQRLPWPIMTIVAGGAMLALRPGAPRVAATVLFATAAVIAVWSAYLGGFHAGVEQHWWPGPPDCTPTEDTGATISFDPRDIVRCDTVAWSLFGLSLAGYNFVFSLVAIGAALAGMVQTLRPRGG